jgi:hypothetical protein
VILELIHEGISSNRGSFAMSEILYAVNHQDTVEWPAAVRGPVTQAVAEALAWLEHAGLAIPDPTQPHSTSWRILSRRGQKLRSREQAAAYREAAILPVSLVHPEILEKSRHRRVRGIQKCAPPRSTSVGSQTGSAARPPSYSSQRHDGLRDSSLRLWHPRIFSAPGKLMRKAFDPTKGPLTDKTLEAGEQQAQSDLWSRVRLHRIHQPFELRPRRPWLSRFARRLSASKTSVRPRLCE